MSGRAFRRPALELPPPSHPSLAPLPRTPPSHFTSHRQAAGEGPGLPGLAPLRSQDILASTSHSLLPPPSHPHFVCLLVVTVPLRPLTALSCAAAGESARSACGGQPANHVPCPSIGEAGRASAGPSTLSLLLFSSPSRLLPWPTNALAHSSWIKWEPAPSGFAPRPATDPYLCVVGRGGRHAPWSGAPPSCLSRPSRTSCSVRSQPSFPPGHPFKS